MKPSILTLLVVLPALLCAQARNDERYKSPVPPHTLPWIDVSGEDSRRVVVAQGTPEIYQGHPSTVLMPDQKTIYAVWSYDHGGPSGPMKRSDDGGKTWSELLPVPDTWPQARNCPIIFRVPDPQGRFRLFVFAGQGPDGNMQQAVSEDEGRTWSPMKTNGLRCVMPFTTVVPVEGGKKLIGLASIRRPTAPKKDFSNLLVQSVSEDGGFTWSPWQVLFDVADPELMICEPAIIRSPSGRQLLCLLRENVRKVALYITSDDEGRTWSDLKPLPPGLFGDRHAPRYAPDGRLVVTFRDSGRKSPTRTHFLAWVGRYEDIIAGRDGQYRIKLQHSYKGMDCGYSGLESLPDGTFVATTYIKYREGEEKNSVISLRFNLTETDSRLKEANKSP